jgi:uncharacterized protein YndB with AHSA1/START domain/DNA-binding transcriptional ArsR family regulator
MDPVFKALADATRRTLLDRLRAENGQTLGELCVRMSMTRQAVTKHLVLLEKANLVVAVWQGREKLHYLNPVPIHDIAERWIGKFDRMRLDALGQFKRGLEQDRGEPVSKPQFVYVTYIASTTEKVFDALTDSEMTKQYWYRHRNASDWKKGSKWEHQDYDDAKTVHITGTVVENSRPKRLVITWANPADTGVPEKTSRVTFDLELVEGMVRLTVTHSELEPESKMAQDISKGWPMVLSSLKSLLETGKALPQIPRPCK